MNLPNQPTKYGPTLPISEEIHAIKYRGEGESFKEAMSRIAGALKDSDEHYYSFRDCLLEQRFLPGGRIQSTVGSIREATPFNCYVSGTIKDDSIDIMTKASEAFQTMRLGGGIGFDFSTLRPRGDIIKSLESNSSGPISFMDIFNSVCVTVSSAGHRRGAMMGVMRIDHPDIEEFIKAKQNTTHLTNFNISVAITDEFMDALKKDTYFSLKFKGREYKQVKAKNLWESLMRSTWSWAEPGVLFIDRINKKNNLYYCEEIAATNPCVAGDTPILTDQGWIQIQDTVGQSTNVWNGFEFSKVTPRVTGYDQDMWTIHLSDGSELRCTSAHKFILSDGSRVEAQHLQLNQALEKSNWPVINGNDKLPIDYYAQGFFSGDGWVKSSTGGQYIGLYGEKRNINHQWNEMSRKTYAIAGGYVNTDCSQTKEYLYFTKGTFQNKDFVPMNAPINNKREWLAGLADSDGTVTKDGSIQISSKDRNFLLDVKALLNTMGANGNLKPMRSCYRISISATHVQTLNIPTKRLVQVVPSRDASRFVRVTDIRYSGKEDTVYCFTEPKRHSGVFNGVYTAQCAEQPLPPYGACLLGSFNLVKYIKKDISGYYFDEIQFGMDIYTCIRAIDNVIDIALFPLEQQKQEALAKRRMGIGLTGVANALEVLGFSYGSIEFLEALERILVILRDTTYHASTILAKEKGAFPLYTDEYLDSEFIKTLPEGVVNEIKKYGIRNSHLLSIAPTGTISLTADNISSGIEPVFTHEYSRTIKTFDGQRIEKVTDYAYRVWGIKGRTADEITPEEHVSVLNLTSKYVDSAVSKTCNIGDDVTWDQFKNVYILAYEGGASGCTTFRASGKRFGILNATEPTKEEANEDNDVGTACTFDPETGRKTCE